MSPSPPIHEHVVIRERVLGAVGVVMIVAVAAGLVWFVVDGRTNSAVPAPPPTLAVAATASATPSPSPRPTPSTSPSPSVSPSPDASASRSNGGSAFSEPLTQKGLPTDDDLSASGQDWSADASYDGPGEAPSLCVGQDLTSLDGLEQIFRRDYTLEDEGYGTALIFDLDDVAAAEAVAEALVKDAADCRTPLTEAGFLAENPDGPTDVAIPEGIWGRTIAVTYRQGEEQPVTREGIGVARAGNRVLFLSLVVQGVEDGEDADARQDLAQALTRAAERLTR